MVKNRYKKNVYNCLQIKRKIVLTMGKKFKEFEVDKFAKKKNFLI